ncbi:hypothetical protein AAVH_17539 [Aphelenchoides avenae]|nr:hypothetical protein AAVH_17539 [Aphelenchus avenae]
MLITKVTDIQVSPENIALREYDIDPLLTDLMAVLAMLCTALVGDVEDECLSAALLLSLHFIELIVLIGPQGAVGTACKLFNKIAKTIMLLFVKTCWDLIKPYIRRNAGPATGAESA